MWTSRLIVLPLLLAAAACDSSEPRLAALVEQECGSEITRNQNASIPHAPRIAQMREDWVQADGTVEWRAESGEVSRNAWTCDVFRGDDGVWRRQYMSFGPA